MDRFYFSFVNYTTLGRGDLLPTGHLRLLTAMEAMLGFLVITGSGSFLLKIIYGQSPNLHE
ncbi:ion channel [Palleronia sp. THAF1]|uniref:ion channel n=1 Tax=Palleronia sp. THAF1 TaxID=2587842 RepID=UPI0020C7DEA5|nr:ion channel [Palleronia sp. THAF1]